MSDIKITLIQTALYWEDPNKNLDMFTAYLTGIMDSPDLIVLPEMFNTGFSMAAEKLAESMEGRSISWLAAAAAEQNCPVVTSLIIKETDGYFNRLIWMRQDGSYACYDKRHLFRMAGETRFFKAGKQRQIIELKGWRFCPQICYDLRFPVWSRNRGDYDCLIYVANWPALRSFAWKSLLPARAIENQAYVIGVNRVGQDGHGVEFSGDSAVFDPQGRKISRIEPDQQTVATVTLDHLKLIDFREKFQVGLDQDDFDMKI